MIELLFPAEAQLVIEDAQLQKETLNIYARGNGTEAKCPICETQSGKIHSFYQRHPQDLPCLGSKSIYT